MSRLRPSVKFLFALLSLTGLFVWSCAEVVAPPGGEPDKTKPYVLSSDPLSNAVNVPTGNTVTLSFSEPISRPETGRLVYISPRPSKDPKLKWKGDQLTLEFADSFAVNQTYIISLSPALADLRKNKLDSGNIIAFSTGPTMDSGTISGQIYRDGAPQTGIAVGLFNSWPDSLPFDSTYPDYVVSSSTGGKFTFQNLPKRKYSLVAFADKNNDERFNPGKESFALPDRAIDLTSDSLGGLTMSLIDFDTTALEIISASFTAENLIRLRLSRPISINALLSPDYGVRLVALNDTMYTYQPLGALEADTAKSATVNLWFGKLDSGLYRLSLQVDSLTPAVRQDSIAHQVTPDQGAPTVLSVYPSNAPLLPGEKAVQLTFSEVLDTSSISHQSLVLWSSANQPMDISHRWLDPFRFEISTVAVPPGGTYRLELVEPDFKDLVGNRLGDTVRSVSVQILSPDSLGSVSGTIQVFPPELQVLPVNLSFTNMLTKRRYQVWVTGGNLDASLPAGDYRVSGFIDLNRNRRLDLGSINPFQFAEPHSFFNDTVAVRARFESAGLSFTFD